ncbi:MAG TPA: hypothetical protein VEA19_01880 [Actinomycetota bacterium]|nr:hypothetical protein [Actinomycetota bacterium]
MVRRILAVAAGSVVLSFALPGSAHDLTPPRSEVTRLEVTRSGESMAVSGTATFGGQRLISIGTDPAGDFGSPDLPTNPYDLLEAQIGQLDAANGDFTFVLKVADLFASGGVPEVVRYTWDFGIDMGGDSPVLLQIDGKLTDVIRNQSANVPAFQLRGNCAPDPNAPTVIVCQKIADLTAEMIASSDEIFVDVPRAIVEQQAKGPIAGRPLVPASIFEGIVAVPSAYFSASGTGDTLTWDAETHPYTVAYKRVLLTLSVPGQADRTIDADLAADGSFSASFPAPDADSYSVTAEACFGTNCSEPLSIISASI